MKRIAGHGFRGFMWAGAAAGLLIAAGTIPASGQEAGSAPKVKVVDPIDLIRAKAAEIKTVKASQTVVMPMMGQEMKISGKLVFMAPGKMRMESTMEGMPAGNMIVVNDGETAYTHMPAMGLTQKIDLKRVREVLGKEFPVTQGANPGQTETNFSDPLGGLVKGSIESLGSETVDGVECHVLQGKLAVPEGMEKVVGKMLPDAMKLWLGKEDGMLRRQLLLNPDGSQMMEVRFGNVEVNGEVDENLFHYTPKPDEKVLDMTETVIKTFQGQGEGAPAPGGSAPKAEMPERGI